MDGYLRDRASQNFEKYLTEFLNTGKTVGLPAERLTESEWKQINAELAALGAQLIPSADNGVLYYWFAKSGNKNDLRNRASKNFDKYLNDFLTAGSPVGLPALRLTESEWKQLNTELDAQGIQLVPSMLNGALYYWFTKSDTAKSGNKNDLRNRASKNFDKYLNDFLHYGKSAGLPALRMTEDEWKELNRQLVDEGIQLVPSKQNGILYYWFTKASRPMDRISVFANGKEELENKLIEIIQKKYPTLSTVFILNILRSDNPTDEDVIYRMLRYKQDGEYTDVSQKEFEDAFYYALTSAANNENIINHSDLYNLDDTLNLRNVRYSPNANWPKDRCINMSGNQHWTWFRSCKGHNSAPVYDVDNPKGFHLSLNVRVTKDLLKILDDILIQDGGVYINSYKFPKTNFYDEILSRHDPVTIYMNARNADLEKQIANAIKPFVRSNDGLIGEMLGNGISISPETSYNGQGLSVGSAVSRDIANIIRHYSNPR